MAYIAPQQTAYITGGSSGIGLAIGSALIERGMHVVLFARDSEKLNNAQEQLQLIRHSPSQMIDVVPLDVAQSSQVHSTIAQVRQQHPNPAILINSAGVVYSDYFTNLSYKQFDQMMQVNLYGTWNMITAVHPAMRDHGGCIVNMASVAGLIGIFGYSGYSAAKFGVMGMSEALQYELCQDNIHLAVVCPPDTDTPMLKREQADRPPETEMLTGNAGLLSPEDVAKATLAGISRKKYRIIPGSEGKLIYYLTRFVPGIVRWKVLRKLHRYTQTHARE